MQMEIEHTSDKDVVRKAREAHNVPFQVKIGDKVFAVEITSWEARRRVSGWAGGYISTSCGGGNPTLVIESERVYWLVPVVLTRQGIGVVGEVGVVELNAQHGDMIVSEALAETMQANALKLVTEIKEKQLTNA